MPAPAVDAALEPWPAVRARRDRWHALLLGNGASCAVWRRFAYGSLYERAASGTLAGGLAAEDQALFARLDTVNFEAVLGTLAAAAATVDALALPDRDTRAVRSALDARYHAVQAALAAAVHDRHVPHGRVPAATLRAIRRELRRYRTVFSTNYDLLAYWAVMAGGGRGFRDLFFGEGATFDPHDTRVPPGQTVVLWLHGALHLQRAVDGRTRKRVAGALGAPAAGAPRDLLGQYTAPAAGLIPLVITEGTARQKLAAIERSEYLAYAYGRLRRPQPALVVFGHSLGDGDAHLVDAVRGWGPAAVAVSVWPGAGPKAVMARKLELAERLPDATLFYFDSTTHPLGDPGLAVADPPDPP